jgi:hypothetical protein
VSQQEGRTNEAKERNVIFFCYSVCWFDGLVDDGYRSNFFWGKRNKSLVLWINNFKLGKQGAFSGVKLLGVTITGLAFHKATAISSLPELHLTRKLLDGGYSITFLALSLIVINNTVILLKF